MPFELFPFVCSACLFFGRRFTNRTTVFGVILIGAATTALAGELLLSLPQTVLALMRDIAAAGIGCLLARVIARHLTTQSQPTREEQ